MTANSLELNFELWPKQIEALTTASTECLFGGATRGGKSHLSRVQLAILCSLVPSLQCFIFRKFYDDVIQNHMESSTGFRAMLAELARARIVNFTENTVRWPKTGSLITLGHCSSEDALQKAQGVPKHVLVIDEATQISERRIGFLRAWVTMPEEMKNKLPEQLKPLFPNKSPQELREYLPRILYTGNAIGESMGFFRREFVKPKPKGTIWQVGAFKRQYIESLVEDNPSEDATAVRARVAMMGDTAMTDALCNANWDAPVGDFFPQYSDAVHTVPDHIPPAHAFKFKTFDWGSSDPFCVLWWYTSSGEPFEYQGRKLWFPHGSLICYREWYGCNPDSQSKGLEMRNEDIAKGIVGRTHEPMSNITLTDSLPFQDRGMTKHGNKFLISDEFKENGVPLTLANTARIYGWKQVRDRLIGKDGLPLLYFTASCIYTREYLPALPRDDKDREDAAKSGESTHAADCVRYACATHPPVREEEITQPTDYQSKMHQPSPSLILNVLNKPKSVSYVTRR